MQRVHNVRGSKFQYEDSIRRTHIRLGRAYMTVKISRRLSHLAVRHTSVFLNDLDISLGNCGRGSSYIQVGGRLGPALDIYVGMRYGVELTWELLRYVSMSSKRNSLLELQTSLPMPHW